MCLGLLSTKLHRKDFDNLTRRTLNQISLYKIWVNIFTQAWIAVFGLFAIALARPARICTRDITAARRLPEPLDKESTFSRHL